MKRNKILLVEDDSTLSFIIQDALTRENFDVICASNGELGLSMYQEVSPDLIVADVMMPRMDGYEMVRKIRLSNTTIPIIFLTARTTLDDVICGFEIGANDYLRKPFKLLELIIRIKALLKRLNNNNKENTNITVGECLLDFSTQLLYVKGNSVELSHIEAIILDELFRHPNEVVEAKVLMYRIWQNDDYSNLNRLHGYIYKIRKYLDSSMIGIINIRGIGYKLSVPS